jgi:hypothetical protein
MFIFSIFLTHFYFFILNLTLKEKISGLPRSIFTRGNRFINEQ